MRLSPSSHAAGENISVRRCMLRGSGISECIQRTSRLSESWPTSLHRQSRFRRAARRPSGPEWRDSPALTAAPFNAPAEVPLIAAMVSQSSCRSRSSTPHAKAPCAPPPCKARLIDFSCISKPRGYFAPAAYYAWPRLLQAAQAAAGLSPPPHLAACCPDAPTAVAARASRVSRPVRRPAPTTGMTAPRTTAGSTGFRRPLHHWPPAHT